MRSLVRKQSYGSVRIFWLDRVEALQRLHDAAENLVRARPDVAAVYLFGSLAEGRAVPGSDADVLIVLDRASRPFLDRPLEFHPYFAAAGMPVELFCYTIEEAAQNSFARGAMGRGIVLAQRDSPSRAVTR